MKHGTDASTWIPGTSPELPISISKFEVCELCRRVCQRRPTSMRQKHGYAHRRASQIRPLTYLPSIRGRVFRSPSPRGKRFAETRADRIGPNGSDGAPSRKRTGPGGNLLPPHKLILKYQGKTQNARVKFQKISRGVILSSAPKMTNITPSHEKVPPPI